MYFEEAMFFLLALHVFWIVIPVFVPIVLTLVIKIIHEKLTSRKLPLFVTFVIYLGVLLMSLGIEFGPSIIERYTVDHFVVPTSHAQIKITDIEKTKLGEIVQTSFTIQSAESQELTINPALTCYTLELVNTLPTTQTKSHLSLTTNIPQRISLQFNQPKTGCNLNDEYSEYIQLTIFHATPQKDSNNANIIIFTGDSSQSLKRRAYYGLRNKDFDYIYLKEFSY